MRYKYAESINAWAELRCGKNEEQGISVPTIPYNVDAGRGAVRYALGPNREPRLLLPISMHEKLPVFSHFAGLTLREVIYSHAGKPLRFIDMTCRITELETVFSEVTDELNNRIGNGVPCVKALLSTLEDFRALLTAEAEREVKDEKILGLMGELLILERLLKLTPTAWSFWRGPHGDRHDFRHKNISIEAKTGSRISSGRIKISSVDQLAPPKGGELFLAHIVLEKAAGGELNIRHMAELAMRMSNNPAEVLKLIQAVGCQDPKAKSWNRLNFNKEAESFYSVTEGFPSITPSSFINRSLPVGTESLTYVVDLSLAEQFKLDKKDLKKLETRFTHE